MAGPTSKYRAGNNNLLTKGLFFEMTLADKSTVSYTLKDRDHTYDGVVYPSMYLVYMAENDPTEWRFATNHLDCWEQWEVLNRCTWFKPYVERWRKELELRMKSESLARIMREAKTTSRDAFTANRYILEKGWEPKDTSKRGRPTKDDIKQATNEIIRIDRQISSDFARLIPSSRN
jgi:hypothetical protein